MHAPCPMHVPLSTRVGFSCFALGFTLFHLHSDAFAFLLLVSPSFNVVCKLQISAMSQFCSLDCVSLVVVLLFQNFFYTHFHKYIHFKFAFKRIMCFIISVWEKLWWHFQVLPRWCQPRSRCSFEVHVAKYYHPNVHIRLQNQLL